MSALLRVDRARAALGAAAVTAALGWSAAALIAVRVLGPLLAGEVAGVPGGGGWIAPLAAAAAAAAAALALWRTRRVRSRASVALWLEARTPELRYALVTLADPRADTAPVRPALEDAVARADWRRPLVRAAARLVVPPLLALGGVGALVALVPPRVPGLASRAGAPGSGAAGAAGAARSALTPLRATVTPPEYTRLAQVVLDEPSVVSAIAGSRVVFQGRGDAARVVARLGDDTLRTAPTGARWEVRLGMPGAPRPLRLADGASERLVVLEPYPDSVPAVTLALPARDSVLRAARGRVELAADARDDFGLAEAWFEYIISSGQGESFRFRTGVAERTSARGERTVALRGALDLGTLSLVPGDLIHLRAVATDGNTATGPGRGVSETRTFRIARAGEYDSVAVEGLPPVLEDTSALSQRMLIMMTEALERRRPRLARDTVVAASRGIARDQARLRRRVSDIIFMRIEGEPTGEESEGPGSDRLGTPEQVLAAAESAASVDASAALDFAEGESPVVAINRPLLEAYNAMWEAGRHLEVGETDDALPHMRAALAAIQRARQAERLYLRGRPPTQVVDLARVRLAGDRGAAAPSRRTASPTGGTRERLAARLDAALGASLDAAALVDSLLLLRIEALGAYPRLAGALGEAAARLRAGDDAVPALRRARAAAAGDVRAAPGLGAWDGRP